MITDTMNCAPGVHLPWSHQPHRAVGERAPHPPVLLGVYRGGEDCREERLGHEPWLPNDQLWLRLLRALPSLLLQQLQLQRSCGSFTADGIQCSVANGTVHDPPGFEGTLSTFDQEEFFDGDAEAMSMATIDQRGLRLRATPVWRWAPGRVLIWPSSRSRRSPQRSSWPSSMSR